MSELQDEKIIKMAEIDEAVNLEIDEGFAYQIDGIGYVVKLSNRDMQLLSGIKTYRRDIPNDQLLPFRVWDDNGIPVVVYLNESKLIKMYSAAVQFTLQMEGLRGAAYAEILNEVDIESVRNKSYKNKKRR